jgi:hypothetical protein
MSVEKSDRHLSEVNDGLRDMHTELTIALEALAIAREKDGQAFSGFSMTNARVASSMLRRWAAHSLFLDALESPYKQVVELTTQVAHDSLGTTPSRSPLFLQLLRTLESQVVVPLVGFQNESNALVDKENDLSQQREAVADKVSATYEAVQVPETPFPLAELPSLVERAQQSIEAFLDKETER